MTNEARKIFVKNLERLMEIRGITQADISRSMGLTASTVSDWCLGKSYPRVDRMSELADLFGVPMNYLTSDMDPYALPSLLNDEEQRLIRAWRGADASARQYALIILESSQIEPKKEQNA